MNKKALTELQLCWFASVPTVQEIEIEYKSVQARNTECVFKYT